MNVTQCQDKNKNKLKGGIFLNNSELETVAKEERNAYFREYRKKNKKRIAEHQKRYWQKKAEQKIQAEAEAEAEN